jgi:hypothetical protein
MLSLARPAPVRAKWPARRIPKWTMKAQANQSVLPVRVSKSLGAKSWRKADRCADQANYVAST